MKIGDTVYQIDACRVYRIEIQKIIYDCGHIAFDDDAIGKSVYLSEDDAKAALKEGGRQWELTKTGPLSTYTTRTGTR